MTETSSNRGAGRITGVAAAVLAAGAALLGAPAPSSAAQPCPDVDVVFARGTGEPPGVGGVGQAFVDALRAQVVPRSVDVYSVDYAASSNFAAGVDFAKTVVDGIRDAGDHIRSEAANCPNTKIVLGGYSQGAALAGFVTAPSVPETVPAAFKSYIPQPLPPEVADHVAAVVLFGEPSDEFMRENGSPAVTIGAPYAPKTLNLCAEGDTICNGAPGGGPTIAHALYSVNGMTAQGAAFAAGRL
ncbi:cutinase family protein [Mycobacterium sp. NBC_00419]|uniref:cutinase family protein n=1 Tax=Mycobacterium sp. NBC_00419 TaxID=2975989 RepID=UPI002E1FA851